MGMLSEFVAPLFRQSQYIRVGGQEYFETTAMNIAKCPYTTGAFAGLFYQAATGGPVTNIIPVIVGGAIVQYLKSNDNDSFNQFSPGGRDKVIDKRPCPSCSEPTPPQYLDQARKNMYTSRLLAGVASAMGLVDLAQGVRTGQSLASHVNPLIWGFACYQVMRAMRFNEVVKGNWVIMKSPPREDEPLYPKHQANDASPQ